MIVPLKTIPRRSIAVPAAKGKATTYVAAPATPSAPPAPTPQDSAVAMGIFGGTAAIMSYVLLKQLVKSASIPGGASNKLAASNALVTVMGVKTVAQEVAFRSTKVDLFSSAPSNVATVPGSVLERSDVGDAVSYLVQLQDGSKITATLLPEEDKKVWGIMAEIASLFGAKKTVYVRVKPLDLEPLGI